MQEDATSQERINLDPISRRTVDTPQSYIRRGQWTHLNPMSGEDSEHLNPDQERTSRSCTSAWERTISILCRHGRETSRSLIIMASKTPSLQGTILKRGKD